MTIGFLLNAYILSNGLYESDQNNEKWIKLREFWYQLASMGVGFSVRKIVE